MTGGRRLWRRAPAREITGDDGRSREVGALGGEHVYGLSKVQASRSRTAQAGAISSNPTQSQAIFTCRSFAEPACAASSSGATPPSTASTAAPCLMSTCARDSVELRSSFGRDSVEIRSRSGRLPSNAVELHANCARACGSHLGERLGAAGHRVH